MKYLEFNGILFNPNDDWVVIYNKLIYPLHKSSSPTNSIKDIEHTNQTIDTVNNLRLKFYYYPNVIKACDAYINNTWFFDILEKYQIK